MLRPRLINSFHAKSSYFTFHPLEVVSRYRDPQLQVGDNFRHFFLDNFANIGV